jgi:hypothetical protein
MSNPNDNYIELLKRELKKIVANKTVVSEDDANWIITLSNTEITVPKINNTTVRKSILGNK